MVMPAATDSSVTGTGKRSPCGKQNDPKGISYHCGSKSEKVHTPETKLRFDRPCRRSIPIGARSTETKLFQTIEDFGR